MNQKERTELQELKRQVKDIADAQLGVSQSVSRILNLLEGDSKLGIEGIGNRINDHEHRLLEIETDRKVFAGKVAVSMLIFSSIGGLVFWFLDRFWK